MVFVAVLRIGLQHLLWRLQLQNLKNKLGDDKVVLGLSGGVDSTVTAVLLHKAIGSNLHCVFVDNGLLRKNEFSSVLKQYEGMGLNVTGVDAKQRFYDALAGESDPEKSEKLLVKYLLMYLMMSRIK